MTKLNAKMQEMLVTKFEENDEILELQYMGKIIVLNKSNEKVV